MKNLKALFLLLIGAIAMSLTSCNTDDGYSAYTPEQQKQIQSQMYGTYTGKLKIQKPSADGTNGNQCTTILQVGTARLATLTVAKTR